MHNAREKWVCALKSVIRITHVTRRYVRTINNKKREGGAAPLGRESSLPSSQ